MIFFYSDMSKLDLSLKKVNSGECQMKTMNTMNNTLKKPNNIWGKLDIWAIDHFVFAAFIILLGIVAMIPKNGLISSSETDYAIHYDEMGNAMISNHGNHLYPYLASATALSCLLTVIMVIICLGGSLG